MDVTSESQSKDSEVWSRRTVRTVVEEDSCERNVAETEDLVFAHLSV